MSIIARVHNMLIAMPYGLEKMLELMDIVESTDVPTACVPVGGQPKIIINPEFVDRVCDTDYKLFMLIQHELHHVLLGHTRLFQRLTREHNIAFDAIINSMLCRAQPDDQWTALFRESYPADQFPYCLLRPPENFPEMPDFDPGLPGEVKRLIHKLYYSNQGTFLEVFELIQQQLAKALQCPEQFGCVDAETLQDIMDRLLGNHGDDHRGIEATDDPELFQAIRQIVEEWPQPPDPIKGRSLSDVLKEETIEEVSPDARVVSKIIGAIMTVSREGALKHGRHRDFQTQQIQQFLPSRDRRAFAMRLMGDLIPIYESEIPQVVHKRNEVFIYVDVSGSMGRYVSLLIRAVQAVHHQVPIKIALFSTEIQEVNVQDIRRGRYNTTGGTDGLCVWQHMVDNVVRSAVLLTDGYVGEVPNAFRMLKRQTKIRCLLTPDGWASDVAPIVSGTEVLPSI